jgi:hypothetical protein
LVEGRVVGGKNRREKGDVGKGHKFDPAGGKRNGVCVVLGTRLSRRCVWDLDGGQLVDSGNREVPQAGVGRMGSGDDGAVVVSDGDNMGGNRGNATGVAKLANGDEGA